MNAYVMLFHHARYDAIEDSPVSVCGEEVPLVIAAESDVVEAVG
jgi:hypothetical protein